MMNKNIYMMRITSYGKVKILVVFSMFAIIMLPCVFAGCRCIVSFFRNTGLIGDTIGGITSPIVGIVSIVLLAYTLIEQLNFNKKQVQLQRQEQFKVTFFQLLQEQREITKSLFTIYEGVWLKNPTKIQKIPVRGQEFFRMGTFVLKNLFDSMDYGRYCSSYDPEEVEEHLKYIDAYSENLYEDPSGTLYSFDMTALKEHSKFCFLNDKYRITEQEFIAYKNLNIEQKIDFVYRRFFNVHEECGFYFRHLYRILYFVKQSEDEELQDLIDEKERRQVVGRYLDLAQFLQAQMSSKEMLMVFYNSFSFPNLRELLIKYNILENLTIENLINKCHNCIEEYHLKPQLV